MPKISALVILTSIIIDGLFAQTPKKILVEEFTQASCYPCAQLNPAFNALLESNSSNVIPLKYQTNWPGTDPMNEHNPAEVRQRVDYYGIVGVPTAVLNGSDVLSPEDVNQAKLDDQSLLNTPIRIELNHSISPNFDSIVIHCSIQNAGTIDFVTRSLVLHIAMVEQQINFPSPPGTNGESEFSYVMRKMIPNADGTPVMPLIPVGDKVFFNYSIPIPPYIYDLRNIGVIAFLQYNDNKAIEQSAYSKPVNLGNLSFYDLSMTSNTVFPSGYCNYNLLPGVKVQNQCSKTINKIQLAYRLNNDLPSSTIWSGSLLPNETAEILFPVKTITPGKNTIIYFLQQINNSLDENNFNNLPKSESFLTYEEKAFDVSFSEDFENVPDSGNPSHTIQIEKYANRVEVVSKNYFNNPNKVIPRMGAYEQSDKSIWIFLWNMFFGEQASIMYEKVDLSKYKNNKLQFDYAYCQSLGVENDRLEIQLSIDCGKTWSTIWNKAGKALATTAPQKDNFFPFLPIATDWKSETIDLSPFDGQAGVNIRFLGTSAYGNNVYLDNIKVGSNLTAVSNSVTNTEINVFPNPVKSGDPLYFHFKGDEPTKIRLYNVAGELLLESTANNSKPIWTISNPGIYKVQMLSKDSIQTQQIIVL